jgi:pilus assembly protein CpaB
MSSNAIRVAAAVLVVLAILLAVIGFRMANRYASGAQQAVQAQAEQQKQAVPQTLVVVATKPLPANKPLDKDAVALVPVAVAPDQYFSNVDDVVSRAPLVDLDKGTPLTPRFFKEGNLLARAIPEGTQALSLKVDDVVGVGGFVSPGDIVDVLVYIRESNADEGSTRGNEGKTSIPAQARILLKDVLVLAYEDRLLQPPKGLEKGLEQDRTQQRRERTAVLAVPRNDTTRVLLGTSLGEVRLALHGQQPEGEAMAAAEAPAAGPAPEPVPASASAFVPAAASAGKAPPADQLITAVQLGWVKPPARAQAGAGVVVYRGSRREALSP